MNKVLLIKHGSLGDIIFSLPVMYTIFKHFKNSEIDILTEKKYSSFLNMPKYFTNIIEDNRSSNIFKSSKILFKISQKKYDLIIDLQNSSRTKYYNFFFRFFSKSKISSSRNFAHFRYKIPIQGTETATQGLFNQIKILGINEISNSRYSWLQEDIHERYNKFVLMIPGVSANGQYKQWDPLKFAKLAKYFENKNYKICIIGTKADNESVAPILKNCKNLINNIDKSPPKTIYSIAKKSTLIISNDTGPGHIASLSMGNILWIVNDNKVSNANINKNKNNYIISAKKINDISVEHVISFIDKNKLLQTTSK